MMLFYLLEAQSIWSSIWLLLAGGGGAGAVVLFMLKWKRFHPKDKADVERVDAEIYKLRVEADKERTQTRIELSEATLLYAERLGEDLERTKHELRATHVRLDETEDELRKSREAQSRAENNLFKLNEELSKKDELIKDLTGQLAQLRVELTKIRDNTQGR